MTSFSPVHWIIVLVIALNPVFPILKMLKRVGLSGWWVLALLTPFVGWVGIWVIASARWPAVDGPAQRPQGQTG